jgi:hypothetical protein
MEPQDDRLTNLAEFMYLSFSHSLWENKQIEVSTWAKLEPYQQEAWISSASTAADYLIIPETK